MAIKWIKKMFKKHPTIDNLLESGQIEPFKDGYIVCGKPVDATEILEEGKTLYQRYDVGCGSVVYINADSFETRGGGGGGSGTVTVSSKSRL